jgi:glycosyltransferase involved in cell wall biosynthesis
MKIYIGYGYSSWTTGVYLEKALRSVCDVVYVGTERGSVATGAQKEDFWTTRPDFARDDVFFYIDSGVPFFPQSIGELACLTVCYLIDAHVDLPLRLEMAKFFDIILVAQRDFIPVFEKKGFKNVRWLPLAGEPSIYQRLSVPLVYDIGFVGHVLEGSRRKQLLEKMARRYRVNDYGRFISPAETSAVYGGSKMVFNCSARGDLNMRVFEALSCGRLLLTDNIGNGQQRLFTDRYHLVIYRSEEELMDLIAYYGTHEEESETIARQGADLLKSRHTYDHRAQEVLEIIKELGEGSRNFNGPCLKRSRGSSVVSYLKIGVSLGLSQDPQACWREMRSWGERLQFFLILMKIFLYQKKQGFKKWLKKTIR